MKKIAILLAALMLMLPLAACGSKKPSGQIAPTFKPSHIGPEIETGSAHGKLYFAAIEDDFTVTAMQISGNRAGSAEFNAREPALSDIRSVFELNEWIEVVLSFNTPVGGGKECDMYVCAHRDFAEYSPETLESVCIKHEQRSLDECFDAEFFISPEEAAPGDYDVIFVKDGIIRVYTVIRLYNEDELGSMTDEQLETLMKSLA